MLQALWKSMDAPEYENRFYAGFGLYLRHFNGSLFKNAKAFPLGREEIGELLAASSHDWRYVEPAIFGTLVEQALEPGERRKLGAHYTPRSYVERLVEVTVMEPLRGDWNAALVRAGDARERGEHKEAVAAIRAFHHQLCTTRVLDPACGSGNFLYVSLELMKRLEGEVLEALAELGETEGIGFETVDPHQFLGIELNVRAAAIAELVLWIGYLQQHYRNSREHPAEPILKAFGNIQQKDAVLTWDGHPELQFEMRDGVAVQVYPNARRPDWQEAEFIVGNPPFIGNKRMNDQLSEPYVQALRRTWPDVTESADFVMYWWAKAADLAALSRARRFGLVTTNSITMAFNRSVIAERLEAKKPISLVYAIPDHPWTEGDATASVRIAMTVGAAGDFTGSVQQVENRRHGQTGSDLLGSPTTGKVTPFLTTGAMLSAAKALQADTGLSFMGVIPVSLRFVLSASESALIAQSDSSVLRRYLSGKDLTDHRPTRQIIDFFGLSEAEARQQHPVLFQHILEHVKPFRDTVVRANHRLNW
ncbi:DNA methyltransferase [Brevundimonas vesicularis]|uniref:DNA methyltransferase n=1 Tax=Brevundimonas vesicularis TaxID=41276 RepID=UPI0030BA3666